MRDSTRMKKEKKSMNHLDCLVLAFFFPDNLGLSIQEPR